MMDFFCAICGKLATEGEPMVVCQPYGIMTLYCKKHIPEWIGSWAEFSLRKLPKRKKKYPANDMIMPGDVKVERFKA